MRKRLLLELAKNARQQEHWVHYIKEFMGQGTVKRGLRGQGVRQRSARSQRVVRSQRAVVSLEAAVKLESQIIGYQRHE